LLIAVSLCQYRNEPSVTRLPWLDTMSMSAVAGVMISATWPGCGASGIRLIVVMPPARSEEVPVEYLVNLCPHDVPESTIRFMAQLDLLPGRRGLRRPEDACAAVVVRREVEVGG
jgi:hypothetical protein